MDRRTTKAALFIGTSAGVLGLITAFILLLDFLTGVLGGWWPLAIAISIGCGVAVVIVDWMTER